MIRLHDYLESGNGYKVRLLLAQLGIAFERVEYDIVQGATRTPDFLSGKNRNGRIPVLETEDGQLLPESNAILCYLAEGTPLLPVGRMERARVLQWLFFEQYSHEPNIATLRFWMHTGLTDERQRQFEAKRQQGHAALGVMEDHLKEHRFFAAGRYTVADIALYAYTHVADEGGFDLAGFPAVRAWLGRVRAQPRHIPITQG